MIEVKLLYRPPMHPARCFYYTHLQESEVEKMSKSKDEKDEREGTAPETEEQGVPAER